MKKWLIAVLCVSLCLILLVGAVNFCVDPLMQYRPLPSFLTFYAFDYDYINPGLAKNSAYDGVLVGTSLAENTDMDKCEAAFGERMIKLIYPGGTSRNNKEILDVAFRAHDLKTVIWVIDDTLYFNSSDELSHELPMYLYDDFLPNDVNYLLNLSVLYNYTFKDVLNSLRGMVSPPLLRGDVWSAGDPFGRDVVLGKQTDDPPQADRGEDYYQANVIDNLEHNVLALMREHPDTEFLFCFPPKCATYWRNALRDGVYAAKLYSMQYVMETLLRESNARVFLFTDRMEWTTDLELYKDNIHFKQSVNEQMCAEMAQGIGEVTQADCAARTSALRETLDGLDYAQIIGD
jgi:hypothetical protein